MRRLLPPLLAVAVLLAVAPTGVVAQREDPPRRCPAGTLLDADRGGRVVLTRSSPRSYYACLRGRRPELMEVYGYDGLSRVTLASPYAAAERTTVTTVADEVSLVLFDARRRRTREASIDGALTDLAVTARGIVVSIQSGSEGRPPRVTRLDATGATAELDRGAIDLRSLAMSRNGRTAYWIRDGVARSAAL
jgi:hypothetical protein